VLPNTFTRLERFIQLSRGAGPETRS
jgi:hypothetical protein